MLSRIRTAIRAVWRRSEWETDLAAELADHVAARAADLEQRGLDPARALRQARLELGSRERYRDEVRAASGFRWLDEIRQDLRYTVRTVARSPGFAAVAIVSLALGVGANTMIFGVVQKVLLEPLPIPEPARVVHLQNNFWPTFSHPLFRDLRDRSTAFSSLAAYRLAAAAVSTGDATERAWGYLATGSYFQLLGVAPALGRFFTPDDDRLVGQSPMVVLSHRAWRVRFGADSGVVGRQLRINALPYTVVGVAPRGFVGTEVTVEPEFWVPMTMQPQIESWSWLEARGTWNSMVIGRLRPDVDPAAATVDLNRIAGELAREFPESATGLSIRLTRPGLFGDLLRRPMMAFAAGVMILAGLVLLAACANLAGMFAARAVDRSREIAVRLATGAGRGRLVRQLLTESLALSLAGGLAGWLTASALLGMLSRWRLPAGSPLAFDVTPDWRVFVIALIVTIAAGLGCALAPIRLTRGVDLGRILKGMPGDAGLPGRLSIREALLAVQTAVAAVLLTACLVSLRGLGSVLAYPETDLAERQSLVSFDLGLRRALPEEGYRFQREILDRVAELPGVTTAAFGTTLPLAINQSHGSVFREDAVDFGPDQAITSTTYSVSPAFLGAIGARLIEGRDFAWTDDRDAPPVAIVNAELARRAVGPPPWLGRRIRLSETSPMVEIIGVVADGRYVSLGESPRPALFRPAGQQYSGTTVMVALTGAGRPVADAMRRIVVDRDPELPVYGVGPGSAWIATAFLPPRIAAVALSGFAALAVMLALTGINGMAAYAVSQRVREIGIRMAMGASRGRLILLLFRRAALLVGIGSLVGLGVAFALARLVAGVVPEASTRDPLMLIGAALTMALIGIGATFQPARRAASIDPVRAVRAE